MDNILSTCILKKEKRSDADNGLCGARWRRVAPLSRATQAIGSHKESKKV